MKKHIPSLLTMSNLFLGCTAIVCAFNGRLDWVPYLVFAAAFADVFDGMVARKLGVSSELGKELDSLADMVTFGVVPGVVLFHLLLESFAHTPLQLNTSGAAGTDKVLWYALPAFIIPLFSALRLAKFNIDTRQTTGFIGLATPASTMFFIGLIAVHNGTAGFLTPILKNTWFLYAIIPIFSYLLVAEIPMFSAKSKSFKWKDNQLLYTFAIFSLIMLFVFGLIALPINVIVYILLSLLFWK